MELNTKEKIKQKLLESRFILIDDKIDYNLSENVLRELFLLTLENNKPIGIIFHTNGGSPTAGLQIYDAIRSTSIETIGYVFSKCDSAGLYPLLACKKRIGLPNSRYLFHSMVTEIKIKHNHHLGLSVQEQMDYNFKNGEELYKRTRNIFIKDLKISEQEIRELEINGEKNNARIFAQQAKEIGLLTDIHDFSNDTPWIWDLIK